jgi:transposase
MRHLRHHGVATTVASAVGLVSIVALSACSGNPSATAAAGTQPPSATPFVMSVTAYHDGISRKLAVVEPYLTQLNTCQATCKEALAGQATFALADLGTVVAVFPPSLKTQAQNLSSAVTQLYDPVSAYDAYLLGVGDPSGLGQLQTAAADGSDQVASALAALGFSGFPHVALGKGAPASDINATPTPAPTAAPPPDQAVFACTGSAPAGIDITYGGEGSNSSASRLPFHSSVRLDPAKQYYNVSAQLQGGGSVACSTTVYWTDSSGTPQKVVNHGDASGGYNIASAQICADFTGGWQTC